MTSSDLASDRPTVSATRGLILRRAALGVVLILLYTVCTGWLLHAGIEPDIEAPETRGLTVDSD